MCVRVVLRPFERAHLPFVQQWFEHPEVRLRLGGPDWPARALDHAEPFDVEFRGRRVLRDHTWLAWDDDVPVGFVADALTPDWEDIVHHLLRR